MDLSSQFWEEPDRRLGRRVASLSLTDRFLSFLALVS